MNKKNKNEGKKRKEWMTASGLPVITVERACQNCGEFPLSRVSTTGKKEDERHHCDPITVMKYKRIREEYENKCLKADSAPLKNRKQIRLDALKTLDCEIQKLHGRSVLNHHIESKK